MNKNDLKTIVKPWLSIEEATNYLGLGKTVLNRKPWLYDSF